MLVDRNMIFLLLPVDGGWSRWQNPSHCSVTCGGGLRTRTRTCNHPTTANGGHQCQGRTLLSEYCNTSPCPVNGGWSSWQNPSPCTVTCGGGWRVRTRSCTNPTPANGGHQCQGRSFQSEQCKINPCPVNGGWSSWQNPSQCTVTCGGGLRLRTRSCTNPTPANGGQRCLGSSLKSEHCNTYTCPAPTTTTKSTTLPTTITSSTPPTTTTTPPTTTTTPLTTTTTPQTTTTTPPTTTPTTITTPQTTTTTPPTTTPTITSTLQTTTTTPLTITTTPPTTTTSQTTTATKPTTTKSQLTTTKSTPTTTKRRFFTIRALMTK